MDTNKVADTLYTLLSAKHSRVYRNAPPTNAVFPYVVFNSESMSDAYPVMTIMFTLMFSIHQQAL